MENAKITVFDVRELAEAQKMEATMIRWEDTREIETITYVLFNDCTFFECSPKMKC